MTRRSNILAIPPDKHETPIVLAIPPDKRAVIVGRTGSGKSTLARAILLQFRYVVVIDPKHEFDLPNAEIVTDPAKLGRYGRRHETPIVVRIDHGPEAFGVYNDVLGWCFERGGCTVYVDEVADLMRGTQAAPNLERLLKQGRSRRIRTIVSTQRPRRVTVSILSEAERYYAFNLLLPDDRKRMAEVMGPKVEDNPPEEYSFWYYDVSGGQPPKAYRLTVGG